jgi:pilus assembly protein CpaE
MPEKILIVDDDLDTLKLVGMMLQRRGYSIVAAINGTQALSKAASDRPDLILLDVMMPDLDGFEVARRLRADPLFASVPILMFTAKAQVDDKVQGFEAGADDYLPKPTHPAELLAHVKALLGRSRPAAPAGGTKRSRVTAFIGAKGGLGTTTIAVNVAVGMAAKRQDVILCELRPGQGIAGFLLGISRPSGLSVLLQKPREELDARTVEKELVTHSSGARVLLGSAEPHDYVLLKDAERVEALVRRLATMCNHLILDCGSGFSAATLRVLAVADQILILVEPLRYTVLMARALMADMEATGIARNKIDFLLANRERSSLQLARSKIEEMIGKPAIVTITPAPELAFQSAESGVPIVVRDPNALISDQLRQLTDRLIAKGAE